MNEIIISILIILGSLFILIASIGFLRFSDFYSRIHSITKASSFGILLLLIAVSIYFATSIVIIKALLIIVFIFLTAPLAAHSIIKSIKNKKNSDKI
jgi:multicomponent Na+:H+ antiporter subunit G